MKTRRVLIGCTIASAMLLPHAALGAVPLYERMKQAIEEEIARTEVDETVVPFLRLVFEEDWRLEDEDVRGMLKGESPGVCGNPDPEKPIDNLLSCFEIEGRIQQLARYENRVRSFGRTLQATATSYELPISDLPGRSLKLAADLRAIINIWSAGTGSIKTKSDAPLIRTVTAEEETFRSSLSAVGNELNRLNKEQLTAAVWRYQYGFRLIRDERAPRFPAPIIPPNSGPGTERQYQYKRWDGVEAALQRVWEQIRDDTFDPPLSSRETVYYTFSRNLLEDTLPDNVIIWARLDGDEENDRPYGDVGLQWEVPIDPVLPSLKKEEEEVPILGGEYPPEPVMEEEENDNGEKLPADGRGLCTNPVSERGYLCRPFAVVPPEERCPTPEEDEERDPSAIDLIFCTNTGSLRYTAAGPDVCREITWQDDNAFDPRTRCRVVLSCGTCGGEGMVKQADGTIATCIEQSSGNATYDLFHSLAHAYQLCGEAPGFDPYANLTDEERNAACCQREGEAFRAQCALMERDGVFEDANGNPRVSPDGIPFNAETCAEALAHQACGESRGMHGCFVSRTYPPSFMQQLRQAASNNPLDVPASCSEAIDPEEMDERLRQLKEAVDARDDVCEPGQVDVYKNRIGNNACYIGQCVEMSQELHRIAAGQTPATAADPEAPWDDPQSGTPLGNVLLNPPTAQARLPSYRPQLFMREMEIALCQLQGLPPRTPPILCAIDARRQLAFARDLGVQSALGLSTQSSEQVLSAEDLLDLAQGVGARLGTNLYGNYLRESNRSFAGILNMANELLEELEKIDFPTEMCPISPGLPSPANQN